eukprot:4116097-Prymnesium_polylepis.1
MDQNISSLLCQLPEMGLQRGYYLHSSFLAMALFNAVGPLFGCPFVTGSLPHSPQFVRSLTLGAGAAGAAGAGSAATPVVAESRVAPLLMYAMIGLPLLAPSLLASIPEAAIDGILVYVGYEGIIATGLWGRIALMFTPADEFPPHLRQLMPLRVHLYTLLQLSLFGLCWLINLSPFGLCVAFLIVSLVPLREVLLPHLFAPDELAGEHVATAQTAQTAPPPVPTASNCTDCADRWRYRVRAQPPLAHVHVRRPPDMHVRCTAPWQRSTRTSLPTRARAPRWSSEVEATRRSASSRAAVTVSFI